MRITITVELDRHDGVPIEEDTARRRGVHLATGITRTADVPVGNPLEWTRAIDRTCGELAALVTDGVFAVTGVERER